MSFEVAAFFVTLARVFRSRGRADIFQSMRQRRRFSQADDQWIGDVGASPDFRRKSKFSHARRFGKMRDFPARRWQVLVQPRGWYPRGGLGRFEHCDAAFASSIDRGDITRLIEGGETTVVVEHLPARRSRGDRTERGFVVNRR
jgi:hypothetical protein